MLEVIGLLNSLISNCAAVKTKIVFSFKRKYQSLKKNTRKFLAVEKKLFQDLDVKGRTYYK